MDKIRKHGTFWYLAIPAISFQFQCRILIQIYFQSICRHTLKTSRVFGINFRLSIEKLRHLAEIYKDFVTGTRLLCNNYLRIVHFRLFIYKLIILRSVYIPPQKSSRNQIFYHCFLKSEQKKTVKNC